MVKITPSLTIHLEKSGQKITLELKEAKELIKSLTNFVQSDTHTKTRKSGRAAKSKSTKVPSLTEAKKQEILSHISRQLSAKPRTLSNLLKGVSYMPNHLPLIRKLVEDQPHVSKSRIGKRMFYYNGSRPEKPKNNAATTTA